MNIFITDISPKISAQNLCDKRLKHMPKESFEMISMALFINTKQYVAPFIIWNIDYRGTGDKLNELFNHKCTQWVASKKENISWLWFHALELMKECEYRFGETHYLYHKFMEIKHWVPTTDRLPTSFPNASGFDGEIFDCYKQCLARKWFVTDEIKPVQWTKRGEPKWLSKYRDREYQGDLFGYNPGSTNGLINTEEYDWELPF